MARKLAWTGTFDALSFDDENEPRIRKLSRDQMGVAFQPIVDLETTRVFADEALARCTAPGLENPVALFELAVAERACGRLGRLIRDVTFERSRGALFVNLHPDELSSRWLVRPDDPICFHQAPLYLEITESAMLTHYELCMDVLKEVCARVGASPVIDDFGAGYSNLKRIVDLEPAFVKLDRSLVVGLERSPRQQILVRHVVSICRQLEAEVVAEGIETVDELRAVIDQGVRFGQGYLLARPGYPPPRVAFPEQVRGAGRR